MVPADEVAPRPRPPLRVRRRLAGVGAGAAAVLLFGLLHSRPDLAEAVLAQGILPAFVRSLSLLTGLVPFAVAELMVAGVVLLLGVGLVREMRRGDDRLPRAALRGGLRLGHDLGIVVALFVVLWGLQHARPGLEDRLEIEAVGEVDVEELAPLATAAVRSANELYLEIHGTRDAGVPTAAPPRAEIHGKLDRAWEEVVARYRLPPRTTLSHGSPKAFLLTPVVRRFGVAGMYFPFTGEALLLSDLPGVLMPKEMAHEMAHQRGFASESDANVLAFLVAREAHDPRIRYAGYIFLQRQLLGAVAHLDLERAQTIAAGRHPGVTRDLEDRNRYWEAARGWTRQVGVGLNHAMLRAHGVPDGIASYQGSTWIFVALARKEGLQVLLPPGATPDSAVADPGAGGSP